MLGNVDEWVADRTADYQSGDATDPHGSTRGTLRSSRGGAWANYAAAARASGRARGAPTYKVSLKKNWSFADVITAPKKPQKLPVILSPEEVLHFLSCVDNTKHRAILTTCYAAGLRISEVICLKPPDIDSQRMVIRVEQGKGQKDRYVMLSPKLLQILRKWWRVAKPEPWLFPGDIPGGHIQREAVELMCQKAQRLCGIAKPITPHSMRHAFAVHLLESGTDVRTIQLLLGHRSLATTARYLRIATTKVCAATSPLGLLPRPLAPQPKPAAPEHF
jgi:site-specific recombinase XerD